MSKFRVLIKLSLLIAFFGSVQVFAQTEISGSQSGILGPGTYLVVGDIEILSRDTLEIVPGTTFLHNGNHTWNIDGLLLALGAEGDSINFLRQNPIDEHRWGGIRFQDGACNSCTIDYCIIDHCYVNSGYLPPYLYGGGIYVSGADITVSNTRISNCEAFWDGAGIYADGADITVDHCLIVDNEAIQGANGGGILLNNCVAAQIKNSVIARNSATGT